MLKDPKCLTFQKVCWRSFIVQRMQCNKHSKLLGMLDIKRTFILQQATHSHAEHRNWWFCSWSGILQKHQLVAWINYLNSVWARGTCSPGASNGWEKRGQLEDTTTRLGHLQSVPGWLRNKLWNGWVDLEAWSSQITTAFMITGKSIPLLGKGYKRRQQPAGILELVT